MGQPVGATLGHQPSLAWGCGRAADRAPELLASSYDWKAPNRVVCFLAIPNEFHRMTVPDISASAYCASKLTPF